MLLKIAFIGAGGVGFTRSLLTDILSTPSLREKIDRVSFTDINETNLEMVSMLCQRDIDSNGINLKIQTTTDRREALKDANYVFNVVRVGGLDAFTQDIEIPLKYGVDQCVGDTLCAGGIMYGQRGIAAVLDFCKDIREVSAPGCMMLNYANPNAMLTWACNKYGGVYTLGLCHGVIHGHDQIAEVLGIDKKELDTVCVGINHQTWYTSVKHKGVDMRPKLLEAFLNHPEYSKKEKVRIDMLKRFGYYSTESNGHLSEYLMWYRKRPEDIMNWIDLSEWITGETGGYLRIATETQNWFKVDFPNWMKEPPRVYLPENRGIEHGAYIIDALENNQLYRGHFNVMNNGIISNLPDECVVEVPAYIDANGINVPMHGDLPSGCAAVCSQSIWVQKLAVEAAVKGDDMLLRQAFMMDPLVGAVCNTPEIWQMVDEMLIAEEKWLPQYSDAIALAKKRFATDKLIPARDTNVPTRLQAKTIEEMSEQAEKFREMANATAKENVK